MQPLNVIDFNLRNLPENISGYQKLHTSGKVNVVTEDTGKRRIIIICTQIFNERTQTHHHSQPHTQATDEEAEIALSPEKRSSPQSYLDSIKKWKSRWKITRCVMRLFGIEEYKIAKEFVELYNKQDSSSAGTDL